MTEPSRIATHDAPVWRERSDFLIFADLSSNGLEGRWEQLWVQQVAQDRFTICCIPFFTYGIALGDTVQTSAASGRKYVVSEVVSRSGRRVLRLWLKGATRDGRERVLARLEARTALCEWSSVDLVAIDVKERESDKELEDFLEQMQEAGVVWEWGD